MDSRSNAIFVLPAASTTRPALHRSIIITPPFCILSHTRFTTSEPNNVLHFFPLFVDQLFIGGHFVLFLSMIKKIIQIDIS